MLYFRDVATFVSHNHSGIRKLTHSICMKYNVSGVDDVLQDVYKTMVKRDILGKYNPNHPSATKISTYLYNLIKNVVRAYRKSNENMIERRLYHPDPAKMGNDSDDVFFRDQNLDLDYENIIHRNKVSDEIDGLAMDLNLFEVYLAGRDKIYRLNKRKNMKVRTRGLSLLKVFKLMRKGLTNREIATKYGVSFMFITVIKNEIKEQLMKFGLYWNETKHRSSKKRFLSEVEIEKYSRELRSCK